MRRGTTPNINIYVNGTDFEGATLYVTIEQKNHEITKTGDDVIVSTDSENYDAVVSVFLTQEETLCFQQGTARIQIRWIYPNGTAMASPIKNINVNPILLEGIINA